MIGCAVILLKDEWSNFGKLQKDRKPYGRKGEEVTVFSVHADVLIVGKDKKKAFPVHIQNVAQVNSNDQ